MIAPKKSTGNGQPTVWALWTRTIWVSILSPRANRPHMHRRRWRLVNCLIRIAEHAHAFAAALATTTCVHTASHDREHED